MVEPNAASHQGLRGSPVKTRPLRQAGQFLREELARIERTRRVTVGSLLFLGGVAAGASIIIGLPVSQVGQIAAAYFLTAVFAVVAFVALRRFKPHLEREIRSRKGLAGELAVGQALDRLSAHGYHVFHDIPTPRGNIDHAVVGPGGAYVIETKTWSRAEGDAVRIVGEDVVTPYWRGSNPVVQVRGLAEWFSGEAARAIGTPTNVRSILVFPGWTTETDFRDDVWVLNEKSVVTTISRARPTITAPDVHALSAAISEYSRSSQGGKPL